MHTVAAPTSKSVPVHSRIRQWRIRPNRANVSGQNAAQRVLNAQRFNIRYGLQSRFQQRQGVLNRRPFDTRRQGKTVIG
jgi:hypothetical protein